MFGPGRDHAAITEAIETHRITGDRPTGVCEPPS